MLNKLRGKKKKDELEDGSYSPRSKQLASLMEAPETELSKKSSKPEKVDKKQKKLQANPKQWEALMDSAFDRLLALEEDVAHKWQFVAEEDDVTVSYLSGTNPPISKAVASVNASVESVAKVLRDINNFTNVDKKVKTSKMVKVIDHIEDETQLLYMSIAPVHVVSARDLCFLQQVVDDESGNECIICWHSVISDDVPKKKGVIRAVMNPSGFIIRGTVTGKTLVTFVVNMDLRGWIPKKAQQAITSYQAMLLKPLLAMVEKRKTKAQYLRRRASTSAARRMSIAQECQGSPLSSSLDTSAASRSEFSIRRASDCESPISPRQDELVRKYQPQVEPT